MAGNPKFLNKFQLMDLAVSATFKILLQRCTIPAINTANGASQKNINTGTKMVLSPKPVKKVRSAPKKGVTTTRKAKRIKTSM
jgi:hypothetical protein